jgi:hypothetical protein
MSAAAAHAARQKNKAKKEASKKDNSPSKWSFRSKKVEDEPSGIIQTDDEDVEYSRCFPTLEVERPSTDGFFLNKLRYYQPEDKYIYEHVYVQIFVAVLIMGNFGVNIAEAQIGTNLCGNQNFTARSLDSMAVPVPRRPCTRHTG